MPLAASIPCPACHGEGAFEERSGWTLDRFGGEPSYRTAPCERCAATGELELSDLEDHELFAHRAHPDMLAELARRACVGFGRHGEGPIAPITSDDLAEGFVVVWPLRGPGLRKTSSRPAAPAVVPVPSSSKVA